MRLLFEIGMEEIPARFLKTSLNEMKNNFSKKLKDERIEFEEIKTFGTPRRLIMEVLGISETQSDLNELNMGPAKSVAFANGEITRAGAGFAKSQGIEVSDLEFVETEKGEYIAARKFVKGRNVKELLADFLKELVLGLTFPKSMRWSDKKIKFARPIEWFLALCDEEIIEFEIEGIKSSNKSTGHRFFGENFEIDNIEDYFVKIRNNNVIIDIEERKNLVVKLINENCVSDNEEVVIEDWLLDEVTNLIECPYPIVGSFNSDFLEVPQEVLIISMEVHQRYFPILDQNGKLLPKFVVVRNGIDFSENVKLGNEKVLSARLADARFFYQEDLRIPLENNVEKLKTVVFQKDLGTIYDKIERIKKIAIFLAEKTKSNSEIENILRTVLLAKADLVSNMIGEKEFTKLQGFMGANYARKFGEEEAVCQGIEEHYYPRFQGDKLPGNIEGVITAIGDKLDTLVGCFGVGVIPSGSKDPFALRRAALGILNIILNSKLDVSLDELLDASLDSLSETGVLKRDRELVKAEVLEFFKQRMINIFTDLKYDKNIINAVLNTDTTNIVEAEKKIKVLEEFYKNPISEKIAFITNRIANISKDYNTGIVLSELFQSDIEKEIYELSMQLSSKVNRHIEDKDYNAYLEELILAIDPINKYFESVMIMDDNEDIKNNRISQIKFIYDLFTKIAVIV